MEHATWVLCIEGTDRITSCATDVMHGALGISIDFIGVGKRMKAWGKVRKELSPS